MTSYEFEKVAKNACAKVMRENFGISVSIDKLQLAWFAHELGNKKCTLYCNKLGTYYPEITYNRDKNELYVDIYKKKLNRVFTSDQFDFDAHIEGEVSYE